MTGDDDRHPADGVEDPIKGEEDFREELVNETDHPINIDPGQSMGVFMLSDPRPSPARNKVTIERAGRVNVSGFEDERERGEEKTIYLASSFSLAGRVEAVCVALSVAGHSVPDRWWDNDVKALDIPDEEWWEHEQVERTANEHWRSIETSDVFVLVAPQDEPKKFNGGNIELGYALAHGLDCYALGEIERSCMYHPVTRVAGTHELLDHIGAPRMEAEHGR